jgi:hypothetical protein
MERRTGWGVVTSIAGGGAIAWIIGLSVPGAKLPAWPLVPLWAVFATGLTVLFVGIGPKGSLDKQIRRAIDARERIVQREMCEEQAIAEYERWLRPAREALHRHRPGYENRFMLADLIPPISAGQR